MQSALCITHSEPWAHRCPNLQGKLPGLSQPSFRTDLSPPPFSLGVPLCHCSLSHNCLTMDLSENKDYGVRFWVSHIHPTPAGLLPSPVQVVCVNICAGHSRKTQLRKKTLPKNFSKFSPKCQVYFCLLLTETAQHVKMHFRCVSYTFTKKQRVFATHLVGPQGPPEGQGSLRGSPRLLLTLPGGEKRGLQRAGNTTFLPAQAQCLVQRMDDMTLGNAGQHCVRPGYRRTVQSFWLMGLPSKPDRPRVFGEDPGPGTRGHTVPSSPVRSSSQGPTTRKLQVPC